MTERLLVAVILHGLVAEVVVPEAMGLQRAVAEPAPSRPSLEAP